MVSISKKNVAAFVLAALWLASIPMSSVAAHAGVDRPLDLEDRVACQRAVEGVYWSHRIWPETNPGPKPTLAAVLSEDDLRAKVEETLLKSEALAALWQQPLSGAQLQAEIDRMARATANPELLSELWEALDDDPEQVAECLARPVLADRLLRSWYAFDGRHHRGLREQAEAELGRYGFSNVRALSGRYEEEVWRRAESVGDVVQRATANSIDELVLPAEEWNSAIADLGSRYGLRAIAVDRSAEDLPLETLSPLQEDEAGFYVLGIVEAETDRLTVARVTWPKVPFDVWWTETARTLPALPVATDGEFRLPLIEGEDCEPDTWRPIPALPRDRAGHVAVWTGSEMLIWGGRSYFFDSVPGGWYEPATDSWYPIRRAGQPFGRADATAVWTGTEMVVWGGWGGSSVGNVLNTGGRYNPTTDSWSLTSTTGVPSARTEHRTVWTGSEMIVWGGCLSASGCGFGYLDTGGRYDPVTDSWTPTSTTDAPTPRSLHSAVWTGSEMIVWGGRESGQSVATGGRYDPVADTWSPMTTVSPPQARIYHTAISTGTEMIIFGGCVGSGCPNPQIPQGGGARYNLASDTWTPTNTAGAPLERYRHVAVWTGAEMIVQGGCFDNQCSNQHASGGRYDPTTDTWQATSFAGAPFKAEHTGVWTGTELVVWGGCSGGECQSESPTGARYDPATDSWVPTSLNTGPSRRTGHSAVWTGAEMLVWAGGGTSNDGKRYDPATNVWTAINFIGSPVDRRNHTAVWTGTEMIIWGGTQQGLGATDNGGRYDPITDEWTPTSLVNVGDKRTQHVAVWTGTEMIVWGGCGGSTCSPLLDTGARYDPSADSWTQTSTVGAPEGHALPSSAWTGSQMIVWGGWTTPFNPSNTGGVYTPATDTWSPTSLSGAPAPRYFQSGSFTGTEMVIWGGSDDFIGGLGDGARYDPVADSWTPVAAVSAPVPRYGHSSTWTGSEVIVWGGQDDGVFPLAGGRYDPVADAWSATNSGPFTPPGRMIHTAIWTGSEVVVWGGDTGGQTNTGGRYCALESGIIFADGFESGDTSGWSAVVP